MKVTVDTSLCIGSGTCALTAPAVFDHDPDVAEVVVLDNSPPDSEREAVELAVKSCPAAVIRLLK
ncbi:ferredoxin [Paractinoplanes durhamensis]|uniref:Ferredoxin n=1 Tax=Paractinoplanes durhamensis TaxID=113563 RepID=A0ABQ3YTA7_9ACTN|nr:ferredoxin [Actinoplanes durhamensis]GIE00821.1 ferredoxin [Actinoplanes durhamensis]